MSANLSGCACGSVCGYTSLSSSPVVCTTVAAAFGLTQIQSRPDGACKVPLVSTPISNPASCSAAIAASSSCSNGSHRRAAATARPRCKRRRGCWIPGTPASSLARLPRDLLRSQTCRRLDRQCRRIPCRRNYRSHGHGLFPCPSIDCSRQTAEIPRGDQSARPPPAACNKFL